MKIKILSFLCFLLFSVSLSTAIAYVMGADDRQDAGQNDDQLAAVRQTGMISIRGEQFVSGLVTGANCDVVVSAGHAAIHWQTVNRKGWRKGQIRGQGDFRFNLQPDSDLEWQKMRLVRSGYQLEKNIGKDEHDWSVFRLEKPALSQCENIAVRANKSDCNGDILMPAFHFDKPDTKLIDASCSIKTASIDGVIVHDCDSKDGSSGAPLFCRHNGRSTLLAINISGLTRKDYYDAGVFGKAGLQFDNQQHKNFAINIGGAFYSALMNELGASKDRSLLQD
jgi:hypothetical protein